MIGALIDNIKTVSLNVDFRYNYTALLPFVVWFIFDCTSITSLCSTVYIWLYKHYFPL